MKKSLIEAFKDTIPVLTGYIVLGIGFGVIMSANGYSILWSVFMSIFIYAGSMQYAAVGLFTGNVSLLTVALTTVAINARHLFYGISMIDKYKNTGKAKPYLIFALTDETYSLCCSKNREKEYYCFVSVFDHLYWITGSTLGAILGSTLNFDSEGIDFALTALFITVFTNQWLNSKKHLPAIMGVVISVVCLIIFGADNFLIPAMIGIAVFLLLMKENKHVTE